MDKREKIGQLSIPMNDKDFASKRAMAQYIGVHCRPYVCAAVQLIVAGGEDVTKNEYDTLCKVINHLHADPNLGLTFLPIIMDTDRLVRFTDASFGNARNDKSQLGYLIILADEEDK